MGDGDGVVLEVFPERRRQFVARNLSQAVTGSYRWFRRDGHRRLQAVIDGYVLLYAARYSYTRLQTVRGGYSRLQLVTYGYRPSSII